MSWPERVAGAYWLVFVSGFLLVALWESRRPVRPLMIREERRWSRHGALMALGFMLTTVLYRMSPPVMALAVADSGRGVLSEPWLPIAARWVLAILVLDLVRYGIHVAHHAVPLLWRVHQVHHSDPDLDASTGARFHPIELIVTQGAYLAAIGLCAPPVGAVVVTELLFAFQSFLSHANASLPGWAENRALLVWVTPTMHRIHHSDQAPQQSSNFGDLFPWWDRLFRTYAAAPVGGAVMLRPGIEGFQTDRSLDLAFMLGLPFWPGPAAGPRR